MSSASRRLNLTLVISDLQAGGAERVMSILANAWAASGHRVRFVVQFGTAATPPFYPLRPDVQVERLDFLGIGQSSVPKTGKVRQLLAMRRAILDAKPDIVLSFMDTVNVRAMLSTLGTGVPVIVTERTDPHVRALSAVWTFLRARLYPRASAVVAQSAEALSFFAEEIRRTGFVVPNPVLPLPIESSATQDGSRVGRTLIALGRLHEVKGFDRLIVAFGNLASRHPDWTLSIWGEGPQRASLEKQIAASRLQGRVILHGQTTAPHRHLRDADLYVMTSQTEGFPMSLGEAMASGLACVSFDCPSGPRQLIRHGIDGLLVANGDVDALTETLSKMMDDDQLRARLGERAREVIERFSLDRILALWDQVFDAALMKGRP